MPNNNYVRRKTDESPMPVSRHLREKDFRDNRLWTYDAGEDVVYTYVNGKRYTAKEFDKKFPVYKPAHFYVCPENPDKTKSYLLWLIN